MRKNRIFAMMMAVIVGIQVLCTGTVTGTMHYVKAEGSGQSAMDIAKERLNIDNPDIRVTADYVLLYSVSEDKVIYHKKALTKTPSASTSKLITALAACQLFPKKAVFKVGDELRYVKPDASRAGLKKGERLSFYQMMSALLLPSGCDAAYTIAVKGGRKLAGNPKLPMKKAIRRFMQYTNELSKKLGAVNSHFVTPDGYDAKNHYTCAYDMALIAKAITKQSRIMKVTKKRVTKVKLLSGQYLRFENRNLLLDKKGAYYVKNCIGFKTGRTSAAGDCLVSGVKKGKKRYICVVLHDDGDKRFSDSKKLLHYAVSGSIK